jgi:hypothetical protein
MWSPEISEVVTYHLEEFAKIDNISLLSTMPPKVESDEKTGWCLLLCSNILP